MQRIHTNANVSVNVSCIYQNEIEICNIAWSWKGQWKLSFILANLNKHTLLCFTLLPTQHHSFFSNHKESKPSIHMLSKVASHILKQSRQLALIFLILLAEAVFWSLFCSLWFRPGNTWKRNVIEYQARKTWTVFSSNNHYSVPKIVITWMC